MPHRRYRTRQDPNDVHVVDVMSTISVAMIGANGVRHGVRNRVRHGVRNRVMVNDVMKTSSHTRNTWNLDLQCLHTYFWSHLYVGAFCIFLT